MSIWEGAEFALPKEANLSFCLVLILLYTTFNTQNANCDHSLETWHSHYTPS